MALLDIALLAPPPADDFPNIGQLGIVIKNNSSTQWLTKLLRHSQGRCVQISPCARS